jgi:hypothetical protein
MPEVTRRSVVQGLAWSAPVIALAAATPAAAASGDTTFTYGFGPAVGDTAAFIVTITDPPQIGASSGQGGEGLILLLCLPEDLTVGVTTAGWAIRDFGDPESTEIWVYHEAPIRAGEFTMVNITLTNLGAPDRTIVFETSVQFDLELVDGQSDKPHEWNFGTPTSPVSCSGGGVLQRWPDLA